MDGSSEEDKLEPELSEGKGRAKEEDESKIADWGNEADSDELNQVKRRMEGCRSHIDGKKADQGVKSRQADQTS